MKEKLLIVISCLSVGGGEKSLVNLLNLFDYNQYDVDLIVLNDRGMFIKQLPNEVNILEKDCSLKYMYNRLSIRDLFNGRALKTVMVRCVGTYISRRKESNFNRVKQYRWERFYKKHIKELEEEYDTVFAFMNDDAMYYVSDKVKSSNKVAWIHNDYYSMGYNAEIDRRHFGNFEKIVTISNECLHILQDVFPESRQKLLMIPNLTSSKVIYQKGELFYPKEYKSTIDKIKILSVGRFSEQKGYDLAIKAAAELKKRDLQFVWYVVGDGALRTLYEKMIVDNSLEKEFILLGVRENPYPYIKNCDIFVQPSRFEGKSVVLDEAKILGKAIVVTNYPTVHDQINEKTGMIVDMNAESIAEGILQVVKEPQIKERMIKGLKKEKLGNEGYIQAYYDLIKH